MPAERGFVMLVDAASMIYRAYFAVPDTVRAPDGTPVNAAHGFLGMLSGLIRRFGPRALACCWDADWRPEWRVELIDSYKTHRVAASEDEIDPVAEQIDLIADLLDLIGIAVVGCDGWEAEDVIAALVRTARGPVAIVSGDRDLFQLVRDPDVFVLYPKRGVSDLAVVDERYIRERYGIPGRAYADFAILRGDPSDGLPGVRGIGEKTAAALIAKHRTLAGVVAAAKQGRPAGPLGKVAASLDYLERAERVVRISGDAPIGRPPIRLPLRASAPALEREAGRLGLSAPVGRLLAAIGREDE